MRHRVQKAGRRPSQRELRAILRDQIRGIDLNPAAIPIAAFSLYLAYLHYQDPREINDSRRLPYLRWTPGHRNVDASLDLGILYAGNAFTIQQHPDPTVCVRFGTASADVVVGNPPWGKASESDQLAVAAMAETLAWCNERKERIVGDNELSQAFVHLAIDLLRDGGVSALLLSSGVLYKIGKPSQEFRRSWLTRASLVTVVNFAHVRHLFFSDPLRGNSELAVRESDGSSPFIAAIFRRHPPGDLHRFAYWSARRTMVVEKTRAIVLSEADMHRLRQDDCLAHEELWKLYWWGNRRDEGLIFELKRFPTLHEITLNSPERKVISGVGYVKGRKGRSSSGWLLKYRTLKVAHFSRYGELPDSAFIDTPTTVRRKGRREIYSGYRILMTRGRGGEHGRIDVRLASKPFCFTHSIIGYRLKGFSQQEAKCIVGILWSSLAKYYLWLTSGSWGAWHDETLVTNVSNLPIALPQDKRLARQIEDTVDKLSRLNSLLDENEQRDLEQRLDSLIYELYELDESDRDAIRDMCRFGLDFFYERDGSQAVKPVGLPRKLSGTSRDLPTSADDGILGYLQTFLQQWNADLESGELRWEIIPGPSNSGVLAALFSTLGTEDSSNNPSINKVSEWNEVLTRIADSSLISAEKRKSIYFDTFIRAVGTHEILIVKRNERRFWTRSMGRTDADATASQAMLIAEKEGQANESAKNR